MNDQPREKLAEILRTYGQIIVQDPRRIESLLRDLCPEFPREINLIVGSAREQVPADLLAASSAQPFGALAGRLSKQLSDDLGITDKAAQWAVESWALALGKVHPSGLSSAAAKAHFEAGNTLVDQDQFAQAAAEYEEAIRHDPEYAEAYNNLGIALAEESQIADAADAFREAVRLDPQDAESQSNLGNALLQLGRSGEGVEHLQEALRLDPDASDVKEALEQAQNSPAISDPLNEAQTTVLSEPATTGILPTAMRLAAFRAWFQAPIHRLLLLACGALLATVLYYHARPAPAPSSVSPPPAAPASVPTVTDTSADEETKFPVQWGLYTIVREDVTGDMGDTQQKVSIQNANGQVLWSEEDDHVSSARECNVTGGSAPDFEIATDLGGNNGDGTDYYFSAEGGLHLLFSCNTNEQGVVEFDHLDNAPRPEMIYRYNLAFFDGLSHHDAGLFYCAYRWNGSQYINATSHFPQRAQAHGLEAQEGFLKNWQAHPSFDYNSGSDDADRADAIEYWANYMAIGKGNEAKVWLMQHANSQMRAHLLAIEKDIRAIVPSEGAKLDATMGDGTILDKSSATASDSTSSPDTSADTTASPNTPSIDASALGTPADNSGTNSPSPSARDTMAAYASEGSGLSDDPISVDRLQSEALSADDLQGKSLRALSISHNTIFASHGCTFTRPSVKSYFEAQPWYHPDPNFTTAMLSPLEQKNVETIRAVERSRFGYGPPVTMGLGPGRDPLQETAAPGSGLSDRVLSLSTLQNSQVTDSDLDGKSLAALSISYNAIYAAHGYVFQRKSLQRIFSQMSWYHQNPAFAESDLTPTEKANIQTIRAFERKRFGY